MRRRDKKKDALPKEFSSYEEAADFWDIHDTTDYLDDFEEVEVQSKLKKRHHELEVDEEIIKALRKKARKLGISVTRLANQILRGQISKVA